jgi:hypothetical protein
MAGHPSIIPPSLPIKRSKAEQLIPERTAEKPKSWLALLTKPYDYDRDELGLFQVPKRELEEGKSLLAALLDSSSEDEDEEEVQVSSD